jgi:tartrate-resistant acid phosphatase type 5
MRTSTSALLITLASADPCIELGAQMNLYDGTYTHGFVCHGLFWKHQRGSGDLCILMASTIDECPQKYPVSITEAIRMLEEGRNSLLATTEIPGTTTGMPPVSKDVPKAASPARKGRSVPEGVPLIKVAAMGDCGVSLHALQPTADVLSRGFGDRDATFLLGDLFYPLGVDKKLGVSDPRIPRLISTLTSGSASPLYPVLGNHDWQGDWEAEIAYTRVDRRWDFPNRYYFRRMSKGGMDVCVWFIDTDKRQFDTVQESWMRSSLESERRTCDWKVVAGHHFLFSAGEYDDNEWLIQRLLPILDENRIDLFLAGHEHHSQSLKMPGHYTWFLTAGALGDLRDKPLKGHAGLVYINKAEVAFLSLEFSPTVINYAFIKTYKPDIGRVLHSGRIEK